MRDVFSAAIGTGLIDLPLGIYYALQQDKTFEPSFLKKPNDLFKAFKAITDEPFEKSIFGVKEFIEMLPTKAFEFIVLVNEPLLLALSDPEPIADFLQLDLPSFPYKKKSQAVSFFKKGNLNNRIAEIGAVQLACSQIVHGHITNSLSRNPNISQEQKLMAVRANIAREFTFQFIDVYSDIQAVATHDLSNGLHQLCANLLSEKFDSSCRS